MLKNQSRKQISVSFSRDTDSVLPNRSLKIVETTRPSRNTFNQFVTGTLKLRPDRREIIVWQLAGFLKSSLKLVGTFTSSLFFITPATLIISRKDVLGVAKTFTF